MQSPLEDNVSSRRLNGFLVHDCCSDPKTTQRYHIPFKFQARNSVLASAFEVAHVGSLPSEDKPSQQCQDSMRSRDKKLKKSLLLFPLEFGPFLEASPNADSESKLSHVALLYDLSIAPLQRI
ncbi:hypothetical protein TURU_033231 [Turdus rufiventris]|nr:hypothetical protein TURU_033231 [Turdus rufiventris]